MAYLAALNLFKERLRTPDAFSELVDAGVEFENSERIKTLAQRLKRFMEKNKIVYAVETAAGFSSSLRSYQKKVQRSGEFYTSLNASDKNSIFNTDPAYSASLVPLATWFLCSSVHSRSVRVYRSCLLLDGKQWPTVANAVIDGIVLRPASRDSRFCGNSYQLFGWQILVLARFFHATDFTCWWLLGHLELV